MRKEFSSYIEQIAQEREDLIFITGDLGYNALENARAKLGERFINAGVAEQNMVSMAAGMAFEGFQVICYSIAPFVVYRALEQIRNDVCFHNMPVYIVGNGGGYGYGIMGSSHHAIEDIGCLSGLPNMTCYVPAFVEDLNSCLDEMFANKKPSYLRLGLGKNMGRSLSPTFYGVGSKENKDAELTIIAQGPIANNVIAAMDNNEYAGRAELFTINKMPLKTLPDEIRDRISRTKNVLTIEEHIAIGGLGSAVSLIINEQSLPVNKFKSLYAKGYPNNLYGSQSYHQEINGLDSQSISNEINSFFNVSDKLRRTSGKN